MCDSLIQVPTQGGGGGAIIFTKMDKMLIVVVYFSSDKIWLTLNFMLLLHDNRREHRRKGERDFMSV